MPWRSPGQLPRDWALGAANAYKHKTSLGCTDTQAPGSREARGVGTGERVPLTEQRAARWALVGAESERACGTMAG